MEPSEEEEEASFMIPPGSSKPVLERSNSSTGTWSPHVRDLYILSFSFFFTFLAYVALQNLESSLHEDDGLGSTSVGVLYLSLTFSALASPLFVVWLGSKRALLVGFSGYWAFVATNLYPIWATMIPASVFLGFTASILWCAEGTYLTFAAKSHAISCDIPEESAIGAFNGQFYENIFAFPGFVLIDVVVVNHSQVVGNLITLALLYFGKGSSGDDAASGTTLLIIVFLGSMAIGITLATFLRPQDPSYLLISENRPPVSPARTGESIKRMFALLREKKMVLLIWVFVYIGFQQAFIWGDFTKNIITPAYGVAWVGGVMAVFGASDAISSVVAGKFSTGLPAVAAITCVGAAAHGLALVVLLCKQEYGGGWLDFLLVNGIAIAWGIGDATLHTQISALIGIFYPNDTEAAFAQRMVWQSVATSATFFASPRSDFVTKLYALVALLVISMAALQFVIMRHLGWGNRRSS